MLGQVVSLTGTWMQGVAQSWLVYRLTHSSVLLGTIGFLTHLPVLLLGPAAGLAADRWPRRNIVLVAQSAFLIQASTLAVVTLTGAVTVPHLLALAAILGAINAFDIPARQSLYVHLVGQDDLPNAIAINSITFNAARVAGPSIGGLFVATLGEGMCFAANAVSYLAVIGALLIMRAREAPRSEHPPALEHLREGFRYAWTNPLVKTLLLLTAIGNVASTPVSVLGPVFAGDIFQRGSRGLGLLVGAMGFGAVIGMVVLARSRDASQMRPVISASVLGTAGALACYALSPWFPLSLAAMAVLGFNLFRQLGATNTLIQSAISDEYRGRIMSLYSMTVVGMLPLGNLLSGFAGHWLGARGTVLAGSAVSIAAAALWFSRKDANR